MYYDIAAYSVFLQHNDYITVLRLIQCKIVLEARACRATMHAVLFYLCCFAKCSKGN